MCWVADHWDDVMSDLSVFHRIEPEEVDLLTARQFWPRVRRLMHYSGAVFAVAMAEARDGEQQPVVDRREEDPAPDPDVLHDPTPAQVRALRDRARRKRFPEAQYGEMRYVNDEEIVRRAGTSA